MEKISRRLRNRIITTNLKIFHFKINYGIRDRKTYTFLRREKKGWIIEFIMHCQMQINNMINIIYANSAFLLKKKKKSGVTLSLWSSSRFQGIRQTLSKFSFFQRDPEERRIPRRTLRIRREDFPLNGTLIDCSG